MLKARHPENNCFYILNHQYYPFLMAINFKTHHQKTFKRLINTPLKLLMNNKKLFLHE